MKKKLAALAATTLAAVLIAGGSYAYLQNQTNEKTNTFTMGEGVKGEIAEPRWDGVCFTGETGCTTGQTLGKDQAANFAPTSVIAKDPTVKNTSDTTPIYAAVSIKYGNGISSYTELNKFATIDFNTDKWDFNADYTVAYYKGEIAAGAKTEPVFNNVTIKSEATDPSLDASAETNMKNFNITVKGFVTQTDVDGATTAKQALDTVFGSKLTD